MTRELRRRRGSRSSAIAGRLGRLGLAATLAASVVATGVAPAMAASQGLAENVSIGTGLVPVETFHISYISFSPLPFTVTDVDIALYAEWTATVTTNVGWDSDEVRQGADLDVSRSAPLTTGELTATWVATGNIGLFGGNADYDIGTHTTSKTIPCSPKLAGAPFDCYVDAPAITIHPGQGPFTTYIKLGTFANFQVTPEGIDVSRSLTAGNQDVAGPDEIGLATAPATESFAMPCTALPGDPVEYALADYSWTPAIQAHHSVMEYIGTMDASGLAEGPAFAVPVKDFDSPESLALTSDGHAFGLGDLKANDKVPTISPMGPFAGPEGSPIQFSATTGSACPIASRVWQFSNGTTSYGPAPQRAFGDNGLFDGQLTITDVTGLSASRAFDVNVSNATPTANAGPDTSADWGRTVAFNGQSTDPGWLDQPTLQYEWEFGDSPSATGGASVVHQYSAPGPYVATFRACDKDGACATDTRSVTVTKRDTSLGYTGPLSGAPSKVTTLSAVLVDEYGQPVVGKKLTFNLGAQSAVGTTGPDGVALVSIKLTQNKGSYPLAVTFPAGDTKYYDSLDAGNVFVVGK